MIFFGSNIKSSGNKAKINKWDYTEIKSLCRAMDTTTNKKATYNSEKIFAKDVT